MSVAIGDYGLPWSTGAAEESVQDLAAVSDVLIVNSEGGIERMLGGSRTPLLCVHHGDETDLNWTRIALALSKISSTAAVATVNPQVALDVAKLGKPTFYMPNVPNRQRLRSSPGDREVVRKALGLPADEKVVLWLGRLSPEKNPRSPVDLAQNLPAGWSVVMAGGRQGEFDRLMPKTGKPKNLHWAGFVPIVGPLLAAADIFLSSAKQEGSGIAMLEAMHCGLPVFASARGIPLFEFGTAIIADTADPPRLAELMLEHWENPRVMRATADYAKHVVRDLYGDELFRARWRKLIADVAQGRVEFQEEPTLRRYPGGRSEIARYGTTVVNNGIMVDKAHGSCDVVLPYAAGDRHLVRRAVESILAQENVSVVVHVVADNCELAELPADDRLRLYTAKGIGPYAIANALNRYYETQNLAIQDADDLSDPDRLTLQLAALNQGWEMVSGGMRQVVEPGSVASLAKLEREPVILCGTRWPNVPHGLTCNGVRTMRLTAFRVLRGFANWLSGSDTDMDVRAARLGILTLRPENVVGTRTLRDLSLSSGDEAEARRVIVEEQIAERSRQAELYGDLLTQTERVRPVRQQTRVQLADLASLP